MGKLNDLARKFATRNNPSTPAQETAALKLPPLPEPYRQTPPVYSMIVPQQREKWRKKWAKMDEEKCEPHHYKHYEWECRKTFEELESRETQLLAAQQRIAELAFACKINGDENRQRIEYLTQQLAETRRAAIEECAKVAEEHIGGYSHIGPLHAAGWTGAAEAISKRIRALAQPAKGE